MRIVILILMLCWPFGRRQVVAPQQRPVAQRELGQNGQTIRRWYEKTPHWEDGYWTKTDYSGFVDYLWKNQNHVPNDEAYWKAIYRKRMEGYPFEPWVWDWPGRKPTDKTWHIEAFKAGKPPDKPKRYELQESYSPYWPGQRENL